MSPASPVASPARAAPRLRPVAWALAALWAWVAFAARDTGLALPTLLAASGSVLSLLWFSHERGPEPSASPPPGPEELAAAHALFDTTLANDSAALLARGARLLGAHRAWLRIEPPLTSEAVDWPADPAPLPDPPWWQAPLAQALQWSSDASPPRCAVALRQGEVRLGVLAFERDAVAPAFGVDEARLVAALAALVSQVLLRRQLEASLAELGEQQLRERRMFLGKLSHKLRTPMTAVLGFAQILALDETLSAEQQDFVREIEAAGQSLLEMLNELVGVERE